MAARKLQTEIERTFKKIAEGIEIFEGIYDKIQVTTNQAQKEKLEVELKKEIKKLQRFRDQVKTWAASNEIKDKRALLEHRKLIETQMEKFKALERELKTKAYSQAGLNAASKTDPAEKQKAEVQMWISEMTDKLETQIDMFEAEQETLQLALRKKKSSDAGKSERLAKITNQIERHKHHQSQLEIVLRMLDNGALKSDDVLRIKDDVIYYVEDNQEPDFEEDEGIYDDLNLEEAEVFGFAADDDDKSDQASAEDPQTPPREEKHAKHEPESKKRSSKHAEKEKEDHESSPLKGRSSTRASVTSSKASIPSSTRSSIVEKPPAPPVIDHQPVAAAPLPHKYAAAAAASSSSTSSLKSDTSVPPSRAGSIKPAEDGPTIASVVAGRPPLATVVRESKKVASSPDTSTVPIPPAPSAAVPKPALSAPMTPPSGVTAAKIVSGSESSSSTPTAAAIVKSPPTQPVPESSVSEQSSQPAESTPTSLPSESMEMKHPPALADLVASFEQNRARAPQQMKNVVYIKSMLEASYQFLPDAIDAARAKNYFPKQSYPVPLYYPQTPLPLFESPKIFERLDLDTLFFIFYYRPGTYQQFLAARELKRQSWRYHKILGRWFQRHEEPKNITDDYEEGNYISFDHQEKWAQQKRDDFRFEYKDLEDELLGGSANGPAAGAAGNTASVGSPVGVSNTLSAGLSTPPNASSVLAGGP